MGKRGEFRAAARGIERERVEGRRETEERTRRERELGVCAA